MRRGQRQGGNFEKKNHYVRIMEHEELTEKRQLNLKGNIRRL
jgi:hypothetical protein